ncbi:hypothetical protein [Ureibacillus manganicus]|uniref:hypothetical protein n=1 Tax=Ureibacillus manganicus TaxID=1266064 RepID=UPI000A42F1C1|nr:hypothetical protein [Ureibacillus manganicus]
MKQFLLSLSYIVAGIGCFYIFSGKINIYSIFILAIGFCGIVFDLYRKRQITEGA